MRSASLRCLEVHGVAVPECTGGEPAFGGEDFHHLEGHGGADGPGGVEAVGLGVEVDGGSAGVEAGQAAVAHRPIGVAAVKASQDGFVRARVEGDQDALEAFRDAAVAADAFDGAVIVANAEAADVEIDELGFIAGGTVEGLQIGLRAFRPRVLFGHQGAQVSLRGGDAFWPPKTIGLDFEAFLQGDDFGDVHERKMEHRPQTIRASAVKMRPRSSGRLVAAASMAIRRWGRGCAG